MISITPFDRQARSSMRPGIHRAVSLFSNCGAGDIGYAKAGFRFEVMAEIDPRRLEVCLLNHPNAVGVPGDLRETWTSVVAEYRKKAGGVRPALLAACPPCQGLSTARSGRGKEEDADAGSKDERNLLVSIVSRVAKALQPDLVVLENVQAFLTRKIRHPKTEKPISAARLLIADLQQDYAVFPAATDLCDYGVPQTRKRVFLTFVRRDNKVLSRLIGNDSTPYPIPTFTKHFGKKPIVLREALKRFGLPSLDAKSPKAASSDIRGGLHSVPVWRDRRYDMVATIPANSGKTAWENTKCGKCGDVDVGKRRASCPKCGGPLLRPVVKSKNGRYRLIHGFRASTYRRMKPDAPAATITTASGHIGSNHTIHPFENRVLSPLECAYLQTFPKSFAWGEALDKWGHTNVRDMIGEAVPPLFTELHGMVLLALLEGEEEAKFLSADDIRCRGPRKKLLLPD